MARVRKLIVAVDDNEVSAYAFTWAFHNLFRKTDHVVVLNAAPCFEYVLPSVDFTGEYGIAVPAPGNYSEAIVTKATEDGSVLVTKFLNQLNQAGISSEGEVLKGDAGSWIVDESKRVKPDMVIVGSHGYGVFKRTLLGSISDYVLHNAECPVVIVRQTDGLLEHDPLSSSGSPRKIVIAVDESDEAVYAFKWALANVCGEADKVIIYHVHEEVYAPVTGVGVGHFGVEEVYVPPDLTAKDQVEALNESEKLVERFMQFASSQTKISCEGMVVQGPTESKVCEGVKALKADILVVGSHGRGAVARTFLGSVSDYMSHHSPCPLAVVKLPRAAGGTAPPQEHAHAV